MCMKDILNENKIENKKKKDNYCWVWDANPSQGKLGKINISARRPEGESTFSFLRVNITDRVIKRAVAVTLKIHSDC